MNSINHKSEKGQAIVYLVIGLVIFLGFVAMAIDGGMALADRRHLQNSADAGSLAGGGMAALSLEEDDITKKNFDCHSGAVISALSIAETSATSRTTDNISATDSGVVVSTDCNDADKYIDVTVDVTATTPSNFLQLVFPNAMENFVDAVTRIYPRAPISPGNAIIALNPEACSDPGSDGGIFYSNSGAEMNVYNGSIFSNGCLRCNGSPNVNVSCSEEDAPPGCAAPPLGSFYGEDYDSCSGTWDPPPTGTPDQVEPTDFNIFDPDCTDPDAIIMTGHDFQKELQQHRPFVMSDARLWCIDGNVSVNAGDVLEGTNVTIFMRNGDFTINGNPQVNLTASTDPDSSPEIPGVLIYLPAPDPYNPSVCTNHVVKLNGTETSTFIGSIMAPCSQVTLNGTGGNTYQGQVIGWNVEVGGDADLNLTYNENLVPTGPTRIDLYK